MATRKSKSKSKSKSQRKRSGKPGDERFTDDIPVKVVNNGKAKSKKAKPKRVGRLVATTIYFRDLTKPVTKAEAIRATNQIHFKSGGTDNEPEQKFSVNRIVTVFEILGLLQRGKDGQLIPVRKKGN